MRLVCHVAASVEVNPLGAAVGRGYVCSCACASKGNSGAAEAATITITTSRSMRVKARGHPPRHPPDEASAGGTGARAVTRGAPQPLAGGARGRQQPQVRDRGA
ncbi:MAG: hypothetical protein AMXMBFR61_26470 [Fimbriimonadales bacterium]